MATKHREEHHHEGQLSQTEAIDRLSVLITDLEHAAQHNAPVSNAMIIELTVVRDGLRT
jgi:hypothetical protein